MTDIPPYLFIITSTALVLGAAITVRGLLGFRPLPEDVALPGPVVDDAESGPPVAESTAEAHTVTSTPVDGVPSVEPIDSAAPSDATPEVEATTATEAGPTDGPPPPPPAVSTVRDLREPLVMTIAGVLICLFTILGIAALVNSA
jgi:hypothetical protein